jgi:hypothetical protein
MRPIRASEIGSFLYCKRAWWYQSQGKPSENQGELAGGTVFHARHGRSLMLSALLRLAGWAILMVAFVLLAVALTIQFWK